MAPGELNAAGCASLAALKELMASQRLQLDFQYYSVPLPADAPCLVLSRGPSLLSPDVSLPLSAPSFSTFDQPQPLLRGYVAAARALSHEIEPAMAQLVEADLVAARAADAGVREDAFHRWLTLGRLMAASRGEAALSVDAWRAVREMEAAAERRRAG